MLYDSHSSGNLLGVLINFSWAIWRQYFYVFHDLNFSTVKDIT